MAEPEIGIPRPSRHPVIRRFAGWFIAGLAAVIPIAGTIWLLWLIYQILLRVGEAIIFGILGLFNFLRGVEPGAHSKAEIRRHRAVS